MEKEKRLHDDLEEIDERIETANVSEFMGDDGFDLIFGEAILFPLFGRMVSEAWGRTLSYLGRSILRARTGEQIANLLKEEGLVDAVSVPLTAGIVCAVYGKKQ